MLGTSRRSAVLSALGICFLVTIWLSVGRLQDNPLGLHRVQRRAGRNSIHI